MTVAGLSPARADSGPDTPIEVTYRGDRTCPTYEQFIANVRRYTKRWRLAEGEPAARRFHVVVQPSATPDITSGRLEIEETGKTPSLREIAGPDCEAVARALAIALAVVIDPEADLSGGAEPPDAVRTPDVPSSTGSTERPSPPPPAPLAQRAAQPSSSRTTEPRLRIEASFGVTSAVVAGVLPVLGANVELEPFARRRDVESSVPRWLSPSLALGVRQSLPRELERSGVTSELLWSAGTAQLCPVRWPAADRLELAPCFELNAGILRASAHGISDGRTSTKPWLDLGGTARATWRLDGGWFVGGTFSVVAPVTRYRFELATQAPVSQAPAVGIALGACAGMGF